jgi:hypothetical protein
VASLEKLACSSTVPAGSSSAAARHPGSSLKGPCSSLATRAAAMELELAVPKNSPAARAAAMELELFVLRSLLAARYRLEVEDDQDVGAERGSGRCVASRCEGASRDAVTDVRGRATRGTRALRPIPSRHEGGAPCALCARGSLDFFPLCQG